MHKSTGAKKGTGSDSVEAEPVPFFGADLHDIQIRLENNERLTFEDGVRLFQSNDLNSLGFLANRVRERLHGKRVYYSINLHLNYTNICTAHCSFCAFSRKPGEAGGYQFSIPEIRDRVKQAYEKYRINEVHIVGGLNPDLNFDYFLEMFRTIHEAAPAVLIKALTAVEIDDLSRRSDLTCKEVLVRLRSAGLGALPGGGAEIFDEAIRQKICAHKTNSTRWLEIHKTAHRIGIPSNCAMLYGHLESAKDRVDHILRLRKLQDETKGFQAFIPMPYNPKNSRLGEIDTPGGFTDLKVFAVSRLLFDNIPHIKVHWPAFNLKLAEVALAFGADDFGGTNLNEKVMHEAGSQVPLDLNEKKLISSIERAGFKPVKVDSSYRENREPVGRRQ